MSSVLWYNTVAVRRLIIVNKERAVESLCWVWGKENEKSGCKKHRGFPQLSHQVKEATWKIFEKCTVQEMWFQGMLRVLLIQLPYQGQNLFTALWWIHWCLTPQLAIIILAYLKTKQYQFPLPADHFQPVLDWWGRL